jgi:hypothetical protein
VLPQQEFAVNGPCRTELKNGETLNPTVKDKQPFTGNIVLQQKQGGPKGDGRILVQQDRKESTASLSGRYRNVSGLGVCTETHVKKQPDQE